MILKYHRQHPAFSVRQDALLCSINDRLAGLPGQHIAPLGDGWEEDLWRLAYQDLPERDAWDELAEAEGLEE